MIHGLGFFVLGVSGLGSGNQGLGVSGLELRKQGLQFRM